MNHRNNNHSSQSRSRQSLPNASSSTSATAASNHHDGGAAAKAGKRKISSETIKEMGRKARMRLEEERNKRKEIVRLDVIDTDGISGTPLMSPPMHRNKRSSTSSSFAKSIQQSSRAAKSKPKSKSKLLRRHTTGVTTTANINTSTSATSNSNILSNNNTSNKHPQAEGETASNLVRVRGVPPEATAERIRKFFTGLSPRRLLLLPPYRRFVSGLDDDHLLFHEHDNDHHNHYDDNHGEDDNLGLRIFVKFLSSPVAMAAVERSGECLTLPSQSQSQSQSHRTSYTLAVTPVSKRVASYLQTHMATDLFSTTTTNNNNNNKRPSSKTIGETLTQLQNTIPPILRPLPWIIASHRLGWDAGPSRIAMDDTRQTFVDLGRASFSILHGLLADEAAQRYNQLWDLHERLEGECMPLWTRGRWDPIVEEGDLVMRLATDACEWMLERMESLRAALFASRVLR